MLNKVKNYFVGMIENIDRIAIGILIFSLLEALFGYTNFNLIVGLLAVLFLTFITILIIIGIVFILEMITSD